MHFAVLDVVLIVLTVLIAVRGFLHGFIDEAFKWAWLVLGLLFAVLFYAKGAIYLVGKFPKLAGVKYVPQVLAFIALFLIVFLVVQFLAHILKDIVNRIHLGGLDKFLGLVFGIAEGLVLSCFVIFVIYHQPLFDPKPVFEGSKFAEVVTPEMKKIEDKFSNYIKTPQEIPGAIKDTIRTGE
jgi:membrane protein required for colicin V production